MELPEELANRPQRPAGHGPTASLTLEAYLRLKAELDQHKAEGRPHISERRHGCVNGREDRGNENCRTR